MSGGSTAVRVLVLVLVLACAAVGGCAGSRSGSGRSVREATAAERGQAGDQSVRGFVVAAAGEVRVCDEILESYPPQCGPDSLLVTGVDPAALPEVRRAEGIVWTDRPVTLTGTVADGVLTVRG